MSARLHAVLTVALVAFPLLWLGQWGLALADPDSGLRPPNLTAEEMAGLSRQAIVALAMLDGVTVLPAIYVLCTLRRLVDLYRRGEVFTRGSAVKLKAFGGGLIAAAVAWMAVFPLRQPVLYLLGEMDEPRFDIQIDVGVPLIGLVVILLARIMDEAAELYDTARLTI